jgi:hypothetical protein
MRTAGKILLGLLMLLFGYLIAVAGYQTLGKWSSIGATYAAVGVLWIITGPTMFVGGLWVLGNLGRNRIPLWIAGVAAVLSGSSLIGGVLSYVIPCSGPS